MNKKTILIIIGVAVISIFIITSIIVRNTATSELSRDTKYTTTTTTTNNSTTKNNSKTNNSTTTKNNSKTNNSTTNKKTSKGCGFKYSNGSTCGRTVGSHSPLCDYHFYQLDSTYKDLVGK